MNNKILNHHIYAIVHDEGEPVEGYILTDIDRETLNDIINRSYDTDPLRYEIENLVIDIKEEGFDAELLEIPEVEI